jgi:cytochrome c-type biogenesis protein CcmH
MKKLIRLLIFHMLFIGIANAADTPVSFTSPAEQARYETLLQELRCLVCQNQSLSDSHADLAQDLRDEVYKMVTSGQDKQATVDFMVARYGDFVLYKPPMKSTTWLLWFGPLLLLLGAATFVTFAARTRTVDPTPLSNDERARVQQLIDSRSE